MKSILSVLCLIGVVALITSCDNGDSGGSSGGQGDYPQATFKIRKVREALNMPCATTLIIVLLRRI